MERELAEVWELSFVVPSDHESSEFKFVLKLMDDNEISVIIEEGSNRVLKARKNAWRTRWLPYCKV
jgi:6-phosphofructo-2-kinase/fructose-2,6-biphosphatase